MDNFPPGLLKDAAIVLTKPLTFYDVKALCQRLRHRIINFAKNVRWVLLFIINLSLVTAGGVRPSEWKVTKVIPLYKSGSLAQIDNILQTFPNSHYFVKDLGGNSLQAANGSSRASQATF